MVGGVDRVGEEGTARKLRDREIHRVGHVRHDRDTEEAVAEVHPVDRIDERVGGDRARVGEEAVVPRSSQCPLAIGTGVVGDIQESAHRQITVHHNPIAQSGGRAQRVGGRRAELETAHRVGGEHQVAGDRDRAERVARGEFTRHRDRLARSDCDRAVTGERLVRSESESVRKGSDIEGAVHVGRADVDVRGGGDRSIGVDRDASAAADEGRSGVAVGGTEREGTGAHRGESATCNPTDLSHGHRLIGRSTLGDRDRRGAGVSRTRRGDQDVGEETAHRINLGAGGGTGAPSPADRHKRGADVARATARDRDVGKAAAPVDIGSLQSGRDRDCKPVVVDHRTARVDRRAGRSRDEVGAVGRRREGASTKVQVLGASAARRADVGGLHRAAKEVEDTDVPGDTRVIEVDSVGGDVHQGTSLHIHDAGLVARARVSKVEAQIDATSIVHRQRSRRKVHQVGLSASRIGTSGEEVIDRRDIAARHLEDTVTTASRSDPELLDRGVGQTGDTVVAVASRVVADGKVLPVSGSGQIDRTTRLVERAGPVVPEDHADIGTDSDVIAGAQAHDTGIVGPVAEIDHRVAQATGRAEVDRAAVHLEDSSEAVAPLQGEVAGSGLGQPAYAGGGDRAREDIVGIALVDRERTGAEGHVAA